MPSFLPSLRCWDAFFLIALFYTAVRVPYVAAFTKQTTKPTLIILDIIAESSFGVDILLTFLSAYTHRGVLVTDVGDIAWDYLKSWFIIDCIATVPFFLVCGVVQ